MKPAAPTPKTPRKPALKVVLDREQRVVLEEIARTLTYAYRDVIRARTILLLGDGITQAEAARRVGLRRRIVRKWAERFVEHGLRGSTTHHEAGGPRVFP